MYVADYNKMTCLHVGGNHLDLYFRDDDPATTTVDETVKKCRRMNQNASFELIDATYATHVLPIAENHSKYGLDGFIRFRINMQTGACYQGEVTGSEESLGNFVSELGICEKENDLGNGVKVMRTTHYIKYNSPELTFVSEYVDDQLTKNYQYEMSYMFKEGSDTCWTKVDRIPTQCTAEAYFDNEATFPQMAFKCTCLNHDPVVLHLSDKGIKLDVIGFISTRFFENDYYNSIDIDLVNYQCTSVNIMNYNTQTNKCYYNTDKWAIYRQLYDVYNWSGKSTGTYLIDHFRGLCFHKDNCLPMKYDNLQQTYGATTYHYCRRINGADFGFVERVLSTNLVEYGTAPAAAQAITPATQACATAGYWDPELVACIDTSNEANDASQSKQDRTAEHPVTTFYKSTDYIKVDKNLTPTSIWAFAITAINTCVVHECPDSDSDGQCDS